MSSDVHTRTILGVDPGLNITGYGLVRMNRDRVTLIEAGTIEAGGSKERLDKRLRILFEGMTSLVNEYAPYAIAMEQLYSHYSHPQTAVLMAHARGVLCLAAARAQIDVFDYPATTVKSSLTGNGRATKEQIQRAIMHALDLKSAPQPLDVSDALALAVCHIYRVSRVSNGG